MVGRRLPAAVHACCRVLHAHHERVQRLWRRRFLDPQRPALAAPLPRSARVGRHVVRQVARREDRFIDLGGRHDQVPEACVLTPPTVVLVRGIACGRLRVHRVVDEYLAVLRVRPEQNGRHRGLVDLRTALLRHRLPQRDRHRFRDLAAGVVRAHRHRLPGRRVHDRVLGIGDVDRREQSLVARDRRVDHRAQLRVGHRARVALRAPRLQPLTIVRPGEVDVELVAADRHLRVHLDVLVSLHVVVEVRVCLVGPVGPRSDLLAHAALAEGDQPVARRFDGFDAEALDELLAALRAELRRTDLRAQVALIGRNAVVRLEQIHDVFALDAGVDELHRGAAEALRPDVHRVRRVAAGRLPGDVGVVALDRREQDQLAFVEDGAEDAPVRQVSAAVVRVVARDDVAFLEPIVPEELQRELDRAHRRQHELRDADRQRSEPALPVHDRRVALVRLVEDRRRCRARHVDRHLERDRFERATDHFRGDRIDLHGRALLARVCARDLLRLVNLAALGLGLGRHEELPTSSRRSCRTCRASRSTSVGSRSS